jgi:hypothetical protein
MMKDDAGGGFGRVERVEHVVLVPPFLEAKVDVTTKHWFSSSAHDSYARTMMLAGEVASDPYDGDANADPRRGAW